MPAGDIHQLTAVQIMHAEPIANVFYVHTVTDSGTGNPLQNVADAFDSQIATIISVGQATELSYDCYLVRKVHPNTTPAQVFPSSLTGSIGTPALPANQALTMRHYSGNGDKNKRGRYFFSGIPEASQNEGRLLSTAASAWNSISQVLAAQFAASGNEYELMHYSKKLNTYYSLDECDYNPRLTKVRSRTPGICAIS